MTFDELVNLGVYEPIQFHGETLYNINMEKAKVHAPEVYYAELDAVDAAILEAIEAGYIEMDFTIDPEGNLDTTYKVLSAGLEAVR